MANPPAEAEPAEPLDAPGESSLPSLLQAVVDAVGVSVGVDDVDRASRACAGLPPLRAVDEAASAVGVRVRWVVAPLEDAAPLGRPDLPVLTRSDAGTWWLLDGHRLGRVRARAIHDPRGVRWWTLAALRERLGPSTRPWGLAEPALPAAALASPDGSATPSRRLRALVRLERAEMSVIVLYGVVAGLLALATPLAIQVLINWLAFGALLQPILLLGAAMLTCLALSAGLQVLQRVAVEALERRLFVRTVADLATRLSRVRPDAFSGESGPELANRFFEVLTLQKAAGTLLLDGITAVLQVVVAVTLLALYHPWLMLFDVLLLAGMVAAVIPTGRGAERTAVAESKAKYAVAAWIEEIARHPRVMRQDGSTLADEHADRLARKWLGARASHFRVFLRQLVGAQVLQVAASATLLVVCGALVLRGQLTVGQLVAAEFIVTAAVLGFTKFADKLDTVYDLLAGIDKLGHLLDLAPEPAVGLDAHRAGPARVELEGATLQYDTGDGLPAVDLVLEPGSRTTVLGSAGAGKSTLASLVEGTLAPTAGAVRRDGADLRRLRPAARALGVVRIGPDDLLRGTVRDNVSLGRPGLGDREVWAALRRVGLDRRVEGLPEGLDTEIAPTGPPLTEVERRAVLIARAVAGEPGLIVADGVLDGLPHDERWRLHRALSAPAPWTLLVTTADLAVVAPDHRLLVLGPGGLDERPYASC